MSIGPSASSSHPFSDPTSQPPSQTTPAESFTLASQLLPPTDAFNPLCASARTSYTRVDLTGANTPRMSTDPVADLSAFPADVTVDADINTDTTPNMDAEVQPETPQTPQVGLTFLLVSGRRRSMAFDPETTIGRVKELVWNAWPNEWSDERPPAPSYLRILYLGKILQDDDTLSKLSFPSHIPPPTPAAPSPSTSTIVHLSIRAQAPLGAEEAPKKKKRRVSTAAANGETDGADVGGCCSCVIC